MSFRIGVEGFTNFLVNRPQDLLQPFLIRSLGVLALSLVILLHLLDLLVLLCGNFGILDRSCPIQVGGGLLNLLLQPLQLGSPGLKLGIDAFHSRDQPNDAGFFVGKIVGIHERDLGIGHVAGYRGRRRRGGCAWLRVYRSHRDDREKSDRGYRTKYFHNSLLVLLKFEKRLGSSVSCAGRRFGLLSVRSYSLLVLWDSQKVRP